MMPIFDKNEYSSPISHTSNEVTLSEKKKEITMTKKAILSQNVEKIHTKNVVTLSLSVSQPVFFRYIK